MSTTINGVTVRLERNPEDWRRYQITIQVASRTRAGLKASRSIDPGKALNAKKLMEGVAAAAAVNAEYLGQKYNDIVDPSTAIRDALKAFGEECRLMGELAKGLPAKLKRLRGRMELTAQEAELVKRMIWLTDRGERLTWEEAEWVNQKIGTLHGAQL